MGQPRLRLVNREAEQDNQSPPTSPRRRGSAAAATATNTGRPKRTRKSDAHMDAAPSEGDAGSSKPVSDGCLRLFQAVKEMEKNGEPLCLAFNKLPSKKEYPDYYVEIKRPISLDIMKSKISRDVYKSVSDFVSDIDLMCSNAQTYNMPESYIYEIAGDIRQRVHDLAAAEAPKSEGEGASSTPHLKLTIHSAEPSHAGGSAGEKKTEATAGTSNLTLRLKRKRDSDNGNDSDGAEENDADNDTPATGAEGKGGASSAAASGGSVLDALFQAIYDADLGAALKLLETPGLAVNEQRRMILKEQVEGVSDDDEYMWAPLHAAAYYGRLKVAQVLCDKGADVEAVDTMHNSTPLAWAAYTGRKRLAKCLVRVYKASVNARNAHDQLPIQIVLDPENPKWAEFLMPTDGSKVDLPTPAAEAASVPDPKKTPGRKAKTRGSESSSQPRGAASPGPAAKTPSKQAGAPATTPSKAPSASAAASQTAQPQVLLTRVTPSIQSQGPGQGQIPAQGQGQGQAASSQVGMPPIPQCIGGIGHQEIVHPRMADAMRDILARVANYKDSDGELLSEVFEELPDKTEYPEYYEVIAHPMALNLVKSRIAAGYRSFDAFDYDMLWIFNNATFFNESDSQIYQDAVTLEAEYGKARREALDRYSIPFDTSYSDSVPTEGHYVHRLTAGELDLYVGDFIYVKGTGGMRIAMITHLRVGGPQDRRKFVDGYWFLTPSEVSELAGLPVYPHQLFAGPAFDSHGVRGICGKCYVLPPNVYARVYPQGFAPQDLYLCESSYVSGAGEGQPGAFKPVTNWAADFKTPLMKPPSFIQYIVPLTPRKQPQEMWSNVGLLPHLGLTVLNREAVARAQAQGQARALAQTPTRPQAQAQPQPQVAIQVPPQTLPQTQLQQQANGLAPMRPPGAQSPAPPPAFTQAYQALTMRHQQSLAAALTQQTQRENSIRQQIMTKVTLSQQQNPGFIGSIHHQALIQQQSQLIQQSQNDYFAQLQQIQQTYNQQTQALKLAYQQQQHQPQPGVSAQAVSPMVSSQLSGLQLHSSPNPVVPMSPGGAQVGIPSPLPRPAQASMPMSISMPISMPMPVPTSMPVSTPVAMSMNISQAAISSPGVSGAPGIPHSGAVRPGNFTAPGPAPQVSGTNPAQFYSQSQQLQQELLRSSEGSSSAAAAGPATPSKVPNGMQAVQLGLSQQLLPGSSAQTMMAMLLQQQQQQQQQQQATANGQSPSLPKQTATPLSPELASQNSQTLSIQGSSPAPGQGQGQSQSQSQDAMELWKKTTRVFVTHGNARITKNLGIQLASPDSSMFLHVLLSDLEANHAVKVPLSASSILLRPVPGPFNSNGKILLAMSVNGRRYLPRLIPDNTVHALDSSAHAAGSDNGMREDTPSRMSDETEKEAPTEVASLIKSASYAYEVPLLTGLNIVDLEVSVAEWKPGVLAAENPDQQVPPALPTDPSKPKSTMKHYLIFLTRS